MSIVDSLTLRNSKLEMVKMRNTQSSPRFNAILPNIKINQNWSIDMNIN